LRLKRKRGDITSELSSLLRGRLRTGGAAGSSSGLEGEGLKFWGKRFNFQVEPYSLAASPTNTTSTSSCNLTQQPNTATTAEVYHTQKG
jgi:hypothetical protein